MPPSYLRAPRAKGACPRRLTVADKEQTAIALGYMNQLAIRRRLATKIAAVVIQATKLRARLLTLSPMMRRLLVITTISNSSGGVEKPWITPAQTNARIGLRPRKFISTPISVKPMMAA